MPGYRRGFSRRRGAQSLNVVNSIKNIVFDAGGLTGARTGVLLAKAVNTPLSTVTTDTSQGCVIKALWISFDVCGLAGTGVLANFFAYLVKNPGDNLTLPTPGSEGGSNEKKFIVKEWSAMVMRNQDGNVPYHWEDWVKLPRRYYRMGTDDSWSLQLAMTGATTGHFRVQSIYKWFR